MTCIGSDAVGSCARIVSTTILSGLRIIGTRTFSDIALGGLSNGGYAGADRAWIVCLDDSLVDDGRDTDRRTARCR